MSSTESMATPAILFYPILFVYMWRYMKKTYKIKYIPQNITDKLQSNTCWHHNMAELFDDTE